LHLIDGEWRSWLENEKEKELDKKERKESGPTSFMASCDELVTRVGPNTMEMFFGSI
jgi:hypothetical protein